MPDEVKGPNGSSPTKGEKETRASNSTPDCKTSGRNGNSQNKPASPLKKSFVPQKHYTVFH